MWPYAAAIVFLLLRVFMMALFMASIGDVAMMVGAGGGVVIAREKKKIMITLTFLRS